MLHLKFDLAGGETAERKQATIEEIYAAKKKAVPAGWNDTDVIQVKVTFSLTWRKRRGISKVIVNGKEEATMKFSVYTVKGKDNKQLYHKACFRCVDCNTLLQAGQYEMCPIADEPRPKADLLCRRHHSERRLSGAWPLMTA